MIAQVVPVTRLRRDTASWSYLVPSGTRVVPGALVVISFAGRECLGVVWHTEEEDDKASKTLTQVLCHHPLIKAPQRQFIEYLSQIGLCSLSTALYVWLPRALRQWPLRKPVSVLLESYVGWHPEPSKLLNMPLQHCVLVPGHRPEQEQLAAEKFGQEFSSLYSGGSETEEVEIWFKIARGEIRLGVGRERALFAPWINLHHVTVIEPEDVFYYHEQTPYLNLAEAAIPLSELTNAQLTVRSNLPTAAAQLLWPGAQGVDTPPHSIRLIDLHKETILNPSLLQAIRETLELDQRVIILYNARDRSRIETTQGLTATILIPGIETLGRQLAKALGRAQLEPEIVMGTRSILDSPHKEVGLTVVLSLDPLLETERFADQLHGLADLGRLFSYGSPAIIQSFNQEHPLIAALRNGQLESYVTAQVEEQHRLGLPPFGQQIVLSLSEKEETEAQIEKVRERLLPFMGEFWQISHPLSATWHKKRSWNLILDAADRTTRLSSAARSIIVALPSPWKALRNPWYLL